MKVIKLTNQQTGDQGEKEVCKLIPCPNCGKQLMTLPKNFPLYDIQCSGCNFKAQVKTSRNRPRASVLGAGWEIMDKVLKSGFLAPFLIINFKWTDKNSKKQEIRFYPFVARKNLSKYQLSPKARRANYKMFRYIELDRLPHFVLYKN